MKSILNFIAYGEIRTHVYPSTGVSLSTELRRPTIQHRVSIAILLHVATCTELVSFLVPTLGYDPSTAALSRLYLATRSSRH